MVTKKDLVIAVLVTFCLTATLFVIIPTKSSPNGYDPWLDTNDDGIINILDFVLLAKAYGAIGDSTKNVGVIGMPYNVTQGIITMSSGGSSEYVTSSINCEGYSRLSLLCAATTATSIGGLSTNNVVVSLMEIEWYYPSLYDVPTSKEVVSSNAFSMTVYNAGSYLFPRSFITDTKAPYCRLYFSYATHFGSIVPESWSVTFNWAVYLRNE